MAGKEVLYILPSVVGAYEKSSNAATDPERGIPLKEAYSGPVVREESAKKERRGERLLKRRVSFGALPVVAIEL